MSNGAPEPEKEGARPPLPMRRFHQPHRQSGSTSPLYYSYEVAGLHIIMTGSYAPFNKGSEQYAWLERDLAAVDRWVWGGGWGLLVGVSV